MSLEDFSSEDRELANLARQLSSGNTRDQFLRLTKQVRPDVPMPELDIQDRTNAALKQAEDRVASLEARLREKDAVNELDRRRKNIVNKGLVAESDVAKVEQLMLDKKIQDHEAAAEYFNFMQQAAVPTPSGYNPNPIKQFDLSAFKKNPVQAAREVAAQAMQEFRKPVRPIGLG